MISIKFDGLARCAAPQCVEKQKFNTFVLLAGGNFGAIPPTGWRFTVANPGPFNPVVALCPKHADLGEQKRVELAGH